MSYVAILSGKKAWVATRGSMSWSITMAVRGRPFERKFSQYFQELDGAAKKWYVQKINSISEKLNDLMLHFSALQLTTPRTLPDILYPDIYVLLVPKGTVNNTHWYLCIISA